MDPFDSPQAEGGFKIGELSAAVAVSDAISGMLRNALGWFLVMVTFMVAIFIGICPTVVGWIVLLPLMTWGLQAYALEAVDGNANYMTLFSGWEQFGTMMARMWGLFILGGLAYGLLFTPPFVLISYPELQMMVQGDFAAFEQAQIMFTVKSMAVGLLMSLLAVRFILVLPFVVDHDKPILEAISESWQRTGSHWLTLIGIILLYQLLLVPGQVLNLGAAQFNTQAQSNPEELVAALPLVLGAQLFATVLNLVVAVFFSMLTASVFRQLAGPSPQKAAGA
ncbi:MAG: glycerophosphoryl diester phosphodiesterase membrane domain-containing protein [Myxococcota bacterium]